MSYYTQALLARDTDFLMRVTACAATQGVESAPGWAQDHSWQLSAQPGWDAAYAYALAAGNEHPGRDAAVITDGQILAGVQAIITAEG